MRKFFRTLSALALTAGLAACGGGLERQGPVHPTLDLTPLIDQRPPSQRVPASAMAAEYRALPGWGADNHASALPAFQRTCTWIDSQAGDPKKPIGSQREAGTVGDWLALCAQIRSLPRNDGEAVRQFVEANFVPKALGGGDDGLFTGYYEPTLKGSWTRGGRFQTPLYKMPPKTGRLPSRAEIVGGALSGRGLELLWVDDPVDAFFLQVQGSGRVEMTDGSVVQLGYAGQNGHEYFPIGRYFIDNGAAAREDMSLQWLRRWLHNHPDDAERIMSMNPSYVFFKRNAGGPRGTRNLLITEGRSLAVDPAHVSLTAPIWVDLDGTPLPGGKLQRLMLAQDTGGAIKGPVRGDVFWGHGPLAAEAAGFMKGRGKKWLLALRPNRAQYLSQLP